MPIQTALPENTELVLSQRDSRGVVTLILNQPQSFNALSTPMIAAMQIELDLMAQDETIRCVVIATSGKAFCAGHDLKEMASNKRQADHQALFNRCSAMMLSIAKLPVPVIARVQGIATAAGCQLVAQCDLAVSAPQARFATSGIHYGLFCSTPSVPLTRTIAPKHAMQMLITGEFIDADTALQYGLINAVATDDSETALNAEVEKLISQIINKPRSALKIGKDLVRRQQSLGLDAAYALAGQTMAVNMMDEAAQEGARAFVEKRPPAWKCE